MNPLVKTVLLNLVIVGGGMYLGMSAWDLWGQAQWDNLKSKMKKA